MFKLYLFSIVSILSFLSCSGYYNIELIKDDKTAYTIIYPKNASNVNMNSAKQLAIHLNKISKASFKVSEENETTNTKIISVGNTQLFKDRLMPSLTGRVYKDGIVVKTLGDNVFLNGNSDRESIYAVYQFLEDYARVKFWAPNVVEYPKLRNLVLSDIELIYSPPFYYRSHFSYNANFSGEFATILRENGEFQQLKSEWGQPYKLLGWVHTFSQILPPSKYFLKYPEWFADPEDNYLPCNSSSKMPEPQETQLCLSNTTMQQEFLRNLLLKIKENPSYDLISVSQNDNKGFCRCKLCNSIVEEEGSPSGLLIRFVNLISKEVENRYPNKKVETLAYYATEAPPIITKPRRNVIIRFAPLEADMAYPLESRENHNVKLNIDKWAKISNQNFFWGYNTNFMHALLPYPSLSKTLKDIKYLKTKNFKGVFIQDNTNPEGYGYFLHMQSWVIAKMMWNPDQDQQSLIKEFFYGYYGKSGKYLLEYFNLIESSFKKSGLKLKAYHSDYNFISDIDIRYANSLFVKALSFAAKDKVFLERVQTEKLSFDFLLTYMGKNTSKEKGAFFKGLMDRSYENVNVNYALKNYNLALIEEVETEDAKRAVVISNKQIKIEQGKFVFYRKGYATNIRYDENAEDKLAATISGESNDWAIQYILKDLDPIQSARFDVKASLRVVVKKLSNSNSKINFGVYDPVLNKEVIKKEIAIEKLISSDYVVSDLGEIELKTGYIIWFSIAASKNEVDHLFIDNITLNKK